MSSTDDRILRLLHDARITLESERKRRTEPIAIVGIGCRFPGGASGPAAFWNLLDSGIDATTDIPNDRWNADAIYDADPSVPGKCYVRRGAFLDAIDGFEPEFFGISPREAISMDPQQRLLLEVVWESLEDSGIPPDSLRGSRVGVWVGLSLDDYALRTAAGGDLRRVDGYSALGTARSVAAGRLAYVLDLHGPVMQVDASCASSLLAVHLACQSLRLDECDLALVGGVNAMSSPEAMVALCKLQALAPDGRCKTFDAAANGYGRGEGCGIVVLKRLTVAQSSGDRIYGVIRGSAVNHDGRSNGLTAPNGRAQEAVIRAALVNAGIQASSVGYVEAHGTGTLLGDPVEVIALSRVYGAGRSRESPLHIGSVKTNFGHLEGAAGIAGLIKAVLCLHHERIAAHLNFRRPNPNIRWEDIPVCVAAEAIDWARSDRPRVAGVSAFGLSGTNVHVLVEEATAPVATPFPAPLGPELLVLSARTEAALRVVSGRLARSLAACPGNALRDVGYSLASTRALLEHRASVVAMTIPAACEVLEALAEGKTPKASSHARVARSPGKVAWLFTGQGAQQLGMGRELYGRWPAFQEAMDDAFAALDPHLARSLRSVMWNDDAETDTLNQTAYAQPALFAFGWSMAALWRTFGVKPDFVAGHSIGEITAACVDGVFSLSDAARLVCARGKLMQAAEGRGAMVALAASESDVTQAIARHADVVSIAALNAPNSVVISGSAATVMAIASEFEARGIATKRLAVSHAFHSPLMDSILEPFRAVAQSIAYRSPSGALVSNVNGDVAGPEVATSNYWVRHVREPVRFARGVESLHDAGCTTFFELGPRTVLLPLVSACLPDQAPVLLGRGPGERLETESVLSALGGWFVRGGSVDWQGIYPTACKRVDLPMYPWQRERYWLESSSQPNGGRDVFAHSVPPVPGAVVKDNPQLSFEILLGIVRSEAARVLSLSSGAAVPTGTPLSDLGFDSLMALELRSALTRRVGMPLPATLFVLDAAPEAIAQYLTTLAVDTAAASVPRRPESVFLCEPISHLENPRTRLFCFHDAAGFGSMFVPFGRLTEVGVEVCAVSQARTLGPPSATLAAQYLRDAIATFRSPGPPFALFGHSLGGLMAWRVALELQALEASLPFVLIVSAALSPGQMARQTASPADIDAAFHSVFGASVNARPNVRRDFESDFLLWQAMSPRPSRPLRLPIAGFRGADDQVVGSDEMQHWAELTTRGFSLSVVPGSHAYLTEEGPRNTLLERLARKLGGDAYRPKMP